MVGVFREGCLSTSVQCHGLWSWWTAHMVYHNTLIWVVSLLSMDVGTLVQWGLVYHWRFPVCNALDLFQWLLTVLTVDLLLHLLMMLMLHDLTVSNGDFLRLGNELVETCFTVLVSFVAHHINLLLLLLLLLELLRVHSILVNRLFARFKTPVVNEFSWLTTFRGWWRLVSHGGIVDRHRRWVALQYLRDAGQSSGWALQSLCVGQGHIVMVLR